MSSLPLLNESSGIGSGSGSGLGDETMVMCSPAVLVLLVGGLVIAYDVFRGNMGDIGFRGAVTLILTAIVLGLCYFGLASVSWMIVTVPLVIVVGLVVIVILTLMLTTPQHRPEPPHPRPHPPMPPQPEKEPTMKQAYQYVMDGKGMLHRVAM
jgi:hypothetical protein